MKQPGNLDMLAKGLGWVRPGSRHACNLYGRPELWEL